MWAVVYIASNKNTAEYFSRTLREEGLMAELQDVDSKTGGSTSVQIQVPQSEAEEAQEIIHRLLEMN